MSRYRIGIDVGGTFTDFVAYDMEAGETTVLKVPTTPADLSQGIITGLAKLAAPLNDVAAIAHGTTTATNTLIERDGAHTAFLVTEGFRDTLEIRRSNRKELYDAQWVPPPPLIPRRSRIEIHERLSWDGEVARDLDEPQVADVIETLKAREFEAVAICFLHAYQHPRHELRVKAMVEKALPGAFVTISSEVSQEFGEFARSSTVAANAFVGPKVKAYLTSLRESLFERGFRADVAIMQSNGGVCTIDEAVLLPAKLARSGPAGGAMAIQRLAELVGIPNLVGIDIGGTSADVSLIVDGRPRWTSPLIIEWGMPLLFPSVDVVSIGAGGGSIAWIDDGGTLRMGPHSAGAIPGPVCYGRGGDEPTATDAHLVLGHISADRFIEGSMELQIDPAEQAIRTKIAEPLALGVADAAEGMISILNSAMLQAIRFVTVEKGYDPRDFTLVGFGGGGPLHVVELARELGMAQAIIPATPGVLSAWGMLAVDMVQDRSRTVLKRRKAVDIAELSATLDELRQSMADAFARQGASRDDVNYEYVLDMQYYGQVFSLPVTLSDVNGSRPPIIDDASLADAEERFHREHAREYGHADRAQEIQIVHARVFGRAAVDKPKVHTREPTESKSTVARQETRRVRFAGQWRESSVYEYSRLAPGMQVKGPAIVNELSSTIVLPPGCRAHLDEIKNLVVEIEPLETS